MDKKLIGLLIAGALALTACGSGSGGKAENFALSNTAGSGNSGGGSTGGNTGGSTGGSTTDDSNNNNNTGGSNTPSFNGISNSFTTYVNELDVNGGEPEPNYMGSTDVTSLNTLQVENRSIQLIPENQLSNKTWYETTDKPLYNGSGNKSWSIVGNQLQHAKFGEAFDHLHGQHYRFAQGDATLPVNMPTARGEVKYKGHSTWSASASAAGVQSNVKKGTSEFTVNFGEKSITGTIKADNVDDINLIGTISSNTFEGLNNTTDTSSNSYKAVTKGAFYGPNAEEVAGVYYYTKEKDLGDDKIDGSKPRGTFGASKQ